MTSIIVKAQIMRPPPCQIEYKDIRILITDRPSLHNINSYIMELKKHKVKVLVRVCEPTYTHDIMAAHGIQMFDLAYADGTPPPPDITERWFEILRKTFSEDPDCCVAVHCVGGLGRAPVLVSCALIELGMRYEDAVEMIRSKRRGAINSKQLAFLEKYRPKHRLRIKPQSSTCCMQ